MGTVYAAGAKPDGYTLLIGAGSFLTLPLTMASHPYKVSAFTPIGRMTKNNFILAVNKDIPVNNLKEFIAYARKNAGQAVFVAGTAGPSQDSEASLFEEPGDIDAEYSPLRV